MEAFYIPVQASEEEVKVGLDSLPRDASDIMDILKAEQAPLDLRLIIAREYFKQGKLEQILEEGSSPEINEYYADVKYERIVILNALGEYHTYLGKIETKKRLKDDHFKSATGYYNRSSKIDVHEPSTWIGKGQHFVAKGDLQQASGFFKIVLDADRNNIPALLGQVCIEFNNGESQEQHNKALDFYKNSLKLYKRALQVHPTSPGGGRLGIALYYYRLGQHAKARQTFERVLQLEPENVVALVVLGIMDLHANEAGGIQKGMEKMRRAFEIYPYCSVALNHLASHFYFTGQHFLVEQLTETALVASNHGLTKANSYYNLARSYHSKGDFEKVVYYYKAFVSEVNKPKDFVLPYYGLGHVQLMLGDLRISLSNFEKVFEVHPENCESMKVVGLIYVQLGRNDKTLIDKAVEIFRKAARVDPRDHLAFMELGGLLVSSDVVAALDALITAHSILKKDGEDVPVELLNNIGVIHFEKEEFEIAEQTYKDALGEGIWSSFLIGRLHGSVIDCSAFSLQYNGYSFFVQLEEGGTSLSLPEDKVTILFNYARLLEQRHETEKARIMCRFILFKIGLLYMLTTARCTWSNVL